MFKVNEKDENHTNNDGNKKLWSLLFKKNNSQVRHYWEKL